MKLRDQLARLKLPEQLSGLKVPDQLARSQDMPHGVGGWIDAKSTPLVYAPLYARVAQLLELTREDDLLEVACGVGALLERHASRARHVAGLDHSPMQVRYARQRLADRIAAGTAEVVQGEAVELPWDDCHFSAVVCVAGLEYMPEPGRVLSEIRRVLRPGGRVVVTMGSRVTGRRAQDRLASRGYWMPTEDQVRAVLRRAGFTNVEIGYFRGRPGVVSAVDDWLMRVAYGSDELRLVRARARTGAGAPRPGS